MNALPSQHAGYIGNSIPLKLSPIRANFGCSIDSLVLYSMAERRGPASRNGCERAVEPERTGASKRFGVVSLGIGKDTLIVEVLVHIRLPSIGESIQGIRFL